MGGGWDGKQKLTCMWGRGGVEDAQADSLPPHLHCLSFLPAPSYIFFYRNNHTQPTSSPTRSIGMNLTNKVVASAFHLPCSTTVVQMVFGASVLGSFGTCLGWLRFGSREDYSRWAIVSLVWGLNLATGMISMQHASLGLVMVMRNLAPLITFFVECLFQEQIPMSPPAVVSM